MRTRLAAGHKARNDTCGVDSNEAKSNSFKWHDATVLKEPSTTFAAITARKPHVVEVSIESRQATGIGSRLLIWMGWKFEKCG